MAVLLFVYFLNFMDVIPLNMFFGKICFFSPSSTHRRSVFSHLIQFSNDMNYFPVPVKVASMRFHCTIIRCIHVCFIEVQVYTNSL